MSSEKINEEGGSGFLDGLDGNLDGVLDGNLDLVEFTNQDVDDALGDGALGFDLDFDAMADTLTDALPPINLDEMGSLGTRSPSPSCGSSSVLSKGSKRSRAEFDSESECDSRRDKASKRMVQNQPETSIVRSEVQNNDQKNNDEGGSDISQRKGDRAAASKKVIRQDREREGRCPDCGLDTHRIAMTDSGFELQPLTIEGEVLNGRCLLCPPPKENEEAGNFSPGKATPAAPAGKKGGRRNSSRKRGDARKSEPDGCDPEPGGLFHRSQSTPTHPPGRVTPGSSGIGSMTPPAHQQQRQSMVRNTQMSPGPSGNGPPFPPPDRRERRQSRFATPTPNQYHSKMALMKQAQLQRRHSAMQHACMVFGKTNNRKKRGGGGGNGKKSRQMSRRPSGGAGGRLLPPERDRPNSSNASLSSVSCSEAESQFSQSSGMGTGGRLGKAMAMGMGMHCTETASGIASGGGAAEAAGPPQQPPQRSMSRSHSPNGPQTPHQQRRSASDTPLSRSGSSTQTPQSVPGNMKNMMSSAMSRNTPQSVPPNMNNLMSSRMGGGGGGGGQGPQSSQSMSNSHGDNIIGNVPPAVRLAHSKLQSSIYHHHAYPLDEETERALVEKTLVYLESGGGDVCDIVSAMRRFPFSLAIQRASCEKLYAHCFDREHAHAVGLVGGIRTVIDSMEHHQEDATLGRGCAGVIKHLAGASKYNLEMLDRMGAVGMLAAAMERHPKNPALLESCCWALEAMARGRSNDVRMRVAKGGGIHAAMKAVERFPDNESLLRAAFHCLRQLGYNPSSYNGGGGGGGGGSGQSQGGGHPQHPKQHSQQQHQRGQHGSGSQQQGPSFHRGGGGGGNMSRGSGMMMPNNMSNMQNMSGMPNISNMSNSQMMAMMANGMGGNKNMNNNMNNSMMGGNSMMGNGSGGRRM